MFSINNERKKMTQRTGTGHGRALTARPSLNFPF